MKRFSYTFALMSCCHLKSRNICFQLLDVTIVNTQTVQFITTSK